MTFRGRYPGWQPKWKHALIQYVFYHRQKRKRDDDNLISSMKYARDALILAGLLEDDYGLVTLPPITRIDKTNPRVHIYLKHIGEDDAKNFQLFTTEP